MGVINAKTLKSLSILLPSLDEQKLIVKKLYKLSTQTQKLKRNYQKKLELLEELKQSILERAFKGELTAKS